MMVLTGALSPEANTDVVAVWPLAFTIVSIDVRAAIEIRSKCLLLILLNLLF
jgi:hypothetical protein